MKKECINFVGSKTIHIHDKVNQLYFDTWLLYPSIDKPDHLQIGPYVVNACLEGKIAKGKFPVVIISHGSGGSHLLYRVVAQYLTEHGYIVAMPEHHGNNRNDNSLEGDNRNLTLRTQHIQLVIDTLLSDSEWCEQIDTEHIFMIGHSMGGCTALAIAGAVPWSRERSEIEVVHDHRVKALLLLAPATPWFQHPDSFKQVNLPICVFSAELDNITPYWQSDLIKQKVKDPTLVTINVVKNAGHLSFLAPFPDSMTDKSFPPSQDPEGFDRVSFHDSLKADVLNFFNKQ